MIWCGGGCEKNESGREWRGRDGCEKKEMVVRSL
jgi:hypothetical protein